MFQAIGEIMHQIALVPLAVMILVPRNFTRRHWLIAAALTLSWLMDSAWFVVGPSPAMTQIGYALQLGIVLVALIDRDAAVWLAAFALFVFAGGFTEPREWLVPLIGGILVAWHAYEVHPALMRRGLAVYFGLGGLAWTYWALAADVASWYTYQGVRFVGLALITAAIVMHARKPQMRLV